MLAAGWNCNYQGVNTWRISHEITELTKVECDYVFGDKYNNLYYCAIQDYGLKEIIKGGIDELKESFDTIEIMSVMTNWEKLEYVYE